MPQVPNEFVQTVMPQGREIPIDIKASPADFGAQVGATLSQTGNELMQQAVARQQLANETAVNDTVNNKFFPQFQGLYQKYYSLQGKDAVDQLGPMQQQMREMANQTRSSLSNAMQQKMFDQEANRRMQVEFAGMGRYADQQDKIYQAQTSASTVQTYTATAADKANDPYVFENSRLGISNEIDRMGMASGQSAETIRANKQKAINDLYRTVVMKQALTDPGAAQAILGAGVKHGDIDGIGQYEIGKELQPLVRAQASRAIANSVLINPGFDGGDLKQPIVNAANQAGVDPKTTLAIVKVESKFDPQAKNPESSASGLFQHINDTWTRLGGGDRNDVNRQIELGVKLEKENVDALKAGLSRAPTPGEIYLAHNQGAAGALKLLQNPDANAENLIGAKAVEKNGGTADMTASQFSAMLQGKFMRAFNSVNPDGPPDAQVIKANYSTMEQEVKDKANKAYPGDLRFQDDALQHLRQESGVTIQADNMRSQSNHDILTQGAVSGVTSMEQLLSDPDRARAYSELYNSNPTACENIKNMMEVKAAKKDDVQPNEENQKLWARLLGQSANNRDGFANTDLNEFYGKMPLHQWQQLVEVQGNINKHDAAEAQKAVDIQQAVRVLNKELTEHGYKPASKLPKDAEEMDLFTGQLRNTIDQYRQENNGKRPSQEDILDMGRRLLTSGAIKGTGTISEDKMDFAHSLNQNTAPNFYIPTNSIPKKDRDAMTNLWTATFKTPPSPEALGYWATAAAKSNEIPQEDRQQITSAYQEKTGRGPSEREIAMYYVQGKLLAKKPAAPGIQVGAPEPPPEKSNSKDYLQGLGFRF